MFAIRIIRCTFFFLFFLRESTVALCTNRSCSAGLAQYWQANNVTTLAATKVDYGLSVVGKQRNSTVSLNVTRHRGGRKRASSNVPVYNRYFSWAFAPLLRSYSTMFTWPDRSVSTARVPPVVNIRQTFPVLSCFHHFSCTFDIGNWFCLENGALRDSTNVSNFSRRRMKLISSGSSMILTTAIFYVIFA